MCSSKDPKERGEILLQMLEKGIVIILSCRSNSLVRPHFDGKIVIHPQNEDSMLHILSKRISYNMNIICVSLYQTPIAPPEQKILGDIHTSCTAYL